MTQNILSQYKETIARNQIILDNFKADNQNVSMINCRRLLNGIGINDAGYVVRPTVDGKPVPCVFYSVWTKMISRSYSEKEQSKKPTYKGCMVCDEWLSFMNFKRWMEKQDYMGKQIDKDILVIGNKEYSPEKCIFVVPHVNSLLVSSAAARGKYPQGVCFDSHRTKPYKAYVSDGKRQRLIGRFKTQDEAESAYVKAKSAYIIKIALQQTSMRLMKALIMHASYMRVNFECKQRATS